MKVNIPASGSDSELVLGISKVVQSEGFMSVWGAVLTAGLCVGVLLSLFGFFA